MINASEMYEKGRAQNFLREKHVDEILELYQNRIEKKYVSKIVPISEIAGEDWNLGITRYIEPAPKEQIIPISDATSELKKSILAFQKSEKNLKQILQEENLLNE